MNSTLNTLVGLIDAMQLKDRIKEAMDGAQLTKAALARATNSTPGAVTQWLSGETKSLKAEKAALMESATGYLSGWLVSGAGYKRTVDLPSNRALAPVEYAQPAINTIAIDTILKALSAALEQADPALRDALAGMLSSLAKSPTNPDLLGALTTMLTPAAFAQDRRKAA